jgi:hypothetical protein
MDIDVYCEESRPDLFASRRPNIGRYLLIGSVWLPRNRVARRESRLANRARTPRVEAPRAEENGDECPLPAAAVMGAKWRGSQGVGRAAAEYRVRRGVPGVRRRFAIRPSVSLRRDGRDY